MTVFSFILAWKVPAPKLDKGFAIGKYFGTGTFECWWAMLMGQLSSRVLASKNNQKKKEAW